MDNEINNQDQQQQQFLVDESIKPQNVFTNNLITSNRRSYTNFSQSQLIQSNLSQLLEKVLMHILSEQLIEIGSFIVVDKCDLELFCQKLSVQPLKDFILNQDSSKLHHQQLYHYQHYEKDLDLIKAQIDQRKLRMLIFQCNKLVLTYKSIQLLINKFKVQIYANSIDGELSRLQCYHLLEKIQQELSQIQKYHDVVKQRLTEKNEIAQFLNYPIKDVYKQEIKRQFCLLFIQIDQYLYPQKQKTEIQPTLTINKKLPSHRQSTITLLKPGKHAQSISNDNRISEATSIKSKITQHFYSIDKRINDTMSQKQLSFFQKYKTKFSTTLYDSFTMKLIENIYLSIQTNFLINNIEEVFEKSNDNINLQQLQSIMKLLKTQICINIFEQIINSKSIQLNEELCAKDFKTKCKQDLKIISDIFTQEQLIKLHQKIHHLNQLTTSYLNQLDIIIHQILDDNKNTINFDVLQIQVAVYQLSEDILSKLYGQTLLMLKYIQNNSIILLQSLSNFLSKTNFSEQHILLYPFHQLASAINKTINQVLHQAQNEIVSNLLFETYICIISKHMIDRRQLYIEQLNPQSKQIMLQISQIIQGKQLKQQIHSYSQQKVILYDLNEIQQSIEWLFDQHILKKQINRNLDSIEEFSFFIPQIISQIKALFEEEFFNENIKYNRIASQLQLFENYVKQEILKKSSEQQLKIQWSNKIFRLFHKINNEYLPTSRATTRRKQTTEPKTLEYQTAMQSPMPSSQQQKLTIFKQSIYVKGNRTHIQQTERLTQSTVKFKDYKELEKKLN
ncbi:unnamed protein product [Paramecium pentaurelia]|uniref:Uncharacterized protein n=1 Tax=Paramecium pentaurelia TaxID=43138 RepID=A0A8S1RRU8_9CILI|nr:unnamed protein product [Paramecium pentaurelia]